MAINFALGNDQPNYLSALQAFQAGRQARIAEVEAQRKEMAYARQDKARDAISRGASVKDVRQIDPQSAYDYAEHLGSVQKNELAQQVAHTKQLAGLAQQIRQLPAGDPRRQGILQQAAPLAQAAGITPDQLAQIDVNNDGMLDNIIGAAQAFVGQAEQYTLAPGSIRFDGSGRKIAEAPFAPQLRTVGEGQSLVEVQPGGGGQSSSGGGSIGERNGNPGNIRDGAFARSQPGYLGPGEGGFARLAPGAGNAAQERLLRNSYLGKGVNTVDSIVEKYAPASENSAASRANYKSYVANKLGLRPGDVVPADKVPQLAAAMREFETGNTGGGARVVAQGPAKSSGPGSKPPSGFRWTPEGDLEPIPGGPQDPNFAKPMTQQQRSLYQGKRRALQAVRNQIERVEAAKNGQGGYLGGLVPGYLDAESGKFDKAVNGLAPLIRQITRVPGEGAMSDYESRLQELTLPSRRDTREARAESLASMRALLDNLQAGYDEILGGGGQRTAPTRPSAAPATPSGGNTIRYDSRGNRIK